MYWGKCCIPLDTCKKKDHENVKLKIYGGPWTDMMCYVLGKARHIPNMKSTSHCRFIAPSISVLMAPYVYRDCRFIIGN